MPPTSIEPQTLPPSLVEQGRIRLRNLLRKVRNKRVQQLMENVGPFLPDRPQYRDPSIGLEKLFDHIVRNTPQLLNGGRWVLEVGPGAGTFMLMARELGNYTWGVELPKDSSPTVAAYAEIAGFWGLRVFHTGFSLSMAARWWSAFDLIHFRGSLDAILSQHRASLDVAVPNLLGLLEPMLKPKGIIWIGHNHGELMRPIVDAIRIAVSQTSLLTYTIDAPDVTELMSTE